jgi:energy-converting hydrogenase Eha subunit C
MFTPLQVIDSFLLNYNVGDVLLLVTVLGAVGIFLQRSNKILGLHLLSLGLLFLVLPGGMLEPAAGSLLPSILMYKLVGLALLVVAPVIYAVSRQ